MSQRIDLSRYRNVVILTGAGVSVASGIRAFRGKGGVWNDIDPVASASRAALERDPHSIWRLFGPLRRQLQVAQPNAAHHALARAELGCQPNQSWTLITQNIDGLHQRAGSRNVVELHGAVHRTRCAKDGCSLAPYVEMEPHEERLPLCPECGSPLRLDIVLFDEEIPVDAEHKAKIALRECDFFLAVGTSGLVTPAANFVRSAKYSGARTMLVNLDPMESPNPYFDEEVLGRSEDLLPKLFGFQMDQ